MVARVLSECGGYIIDSDVLAREVVSPGSAGLRRTVERFGEVVLNPEGGLDRGRLAQLIFSDDQARADLNAIIHPLVRSRAAELETACQTGMVIHVIPLLVETGQQNNFDELVVVDLPEWAQLNRLCERDNLDLAAAARRISSQASRAERLAVASRIIDTSGPKQRTIIAARLLWNELSYQRG